MRSGAVWILLGALVVSLLGGATAAADVTPDDIAVAEEAVADASRSLEDARRRLSDARRRLAGLQERAESLEDRSDELSQQRNGLITEARHRVAQLYMSAGEDGLVVGDPADLSARIAYLVAVSERDVSSVNRLLVQRADLDRLGSAAADELAEQQSEVTVLEVVVASRAAAVGHAEGHARQVQEQYRAQEEERRRREEEARRRQEEEEQRRQEELEAAAQQAQAAIQSAQENAAHWGYSPGAGAEQWRPLVASYFPGGLVDEALRVIACESRGDPFAQNPFTGASGLFQQMPYYWPHRSEKVGFGEASVFHPEANVAASAWLVQTSLDSGDDAWTHWSCKP